MNTNILTLLIELHVKAAIFAMLILGVVYAIRRSSSQNRYSVLKMALGVLTVLPMLMWMAPSYSVPFGWWTSPSIDAATTPIPTGLTRGDLDVLDEPTMSTEALLLVGYLAVSATLLLRMAVSFLRTRRDIRSYRRIDQPQLTALIEQIKQRIGAAGNVELVVDSSGAGPYVWGIARQVIAVPKVFLSVSNDVQRTVLTHELVHIVRRDTVICLASHAMCCLYWINPTLWILNARLRLEMEQSCDDRAVCSGISATDYAGHLLNAIRQFDVTHRPHSAVAMARATSIQHRIRSLLNNQRQRGAMKTSQAVGICGSLLLLGTAIGALAARTEADAALLDGVKSLVPEDCNASEIRLAGNAVEIKGSCSTASKVADLMRNWERAGGFPRLLSMRQAADGQDFDMRLENLQSFAPLSKAETGAKLIADVKRLVPDNCNASEIRSSADAVEVDGHCTSSTRVSAFMRNLARAGGNPSLTSVQTVGDGVDFKLRLTNLESFAPTPAP